MKISNQNIRWKRAFCPAAPTLLSCPACRSESFVLQSGQDRTKIEMLSCRTGRQDRTAGQDDRTSCPVLVSVLDSNHNEFYTKLKPVKNRIFRD